MATSNNTEETIAKYAEGMRGVGKSLDEMDDTIAKLKDAIDKFKKCFN